MEFDKVGEESCKRLATLENETTIVDDAKIAAKTQEYNTRGIWLDKMLDNQTKWNQIYAKKLYQSKNRCTKDFILTESTVLQYYQTVIS